MNKNAMFLDTHDSVWSPSSMRLMMLEEYVILQTMICLGVQEMMQVAKICYLAPDSKEVCWRH